MKAILWCLVLAAAPAAAQLPSREQLAAEAIKDYGMVLGGAELEARCALLEPTRAHAFRDDVLVITPALAQDLGDTRLMTMVAKAAAAEAGSDKYAACDESVKELVVGASQHAKNWAEQIRLIQSQQGK